MLRKLTVLMIIGLVLVSCDKDQANDEWSIRGSVMVLDAQVPAIQNPLADVQMFLLKLDYGVDTLTSQFLKSDIVDSTLTDSEGSYHFDRVLPGDYVVLPNDTTGNYSFGWTDSPDSIWMIKDSDQSEYEINFTTPEPTEENGLLYLFHFDNNTEDFSGVAAMVLFRECRCWEFKGFGDWGIPKFGWSDWYWTEKRSAVDAPDVDMNNEFPDLGWMLLKYENNGPYEYRDVFYIKFYKAGNLSDPTWIKTLRVAGSDLQENNIFKVVWGPGLSVTVTRD